MRVDIEEILLEIISEYEGVIKCKNNLSCNAKISSAVEDSLRYVALISFISKDGNPIDGTDMIFSVDKIIFKNHIRNKKLEYIL